MIGSRTSVLWLMAACLCVSVGCAPTKLGANFGDAYYTMLEGQILNPLAEQDRRVVTGLDGEAAAIAIDQYRKSFEKPDNGLGKSLISSGVQTK